MTFQIIGDKSNPAILFFHAMGVTGESSMPVAEHLKDRYYCIMPTSTVYCEGQKYISKADELQQMERYLAEQHMLSTSSTMTCFIFPPDISITVPSGRRGSLARILCRIVFRMAKVD